MKIELRPLTDIKPYERNPRDNDAAVDAVAESIRRFGVRQPIVVDCDGVIVCGHTRWKAATKLGLEKVPVHVATDLTPEEIRAYRIADIVDRRDLAACDTEVDCCRLDTFWSERTGARRARAHDPFGIGRAERLEHLVRLLLTEQTDHQRARAERELLIERVRERVSAGHVVGAVEEYERLVPHDLEPAGRAHRAQCPANDVFFEWHPYERLAGGKGRRSVVGLVSAVHRKEDLVVDGLRGEERHEPAAMSRLVAADPEVDMTAPDTLGPSLQEEPHEVGSSRSEEHTSELQSH